MRRLCDDIRQRFHRSFEMVRAHVLLTCLSGLERLEQDELVRRIHTAGPFEEDVSRFLSSGRGEVVDEYEPIVTVLGTDGELDSDEDHGVGLLRLRVASRFRIDE